MEAKCQRQPLEWTRMAVLVNEYNLVSQWRSYLLQITKFYQKKNVLLISQEYDLRIYYNSNDLRRNIVDNLSFTKL